MTEDRAGTLFRYAPLGGTTFHDLVPEAERSQLPDSLIVHTSDGRLLLRSAAVLYLGRRLGGWWGVLAFFLRWLPAGLLDYLYDRLAAIRLRLFRRPKQSCPVLPLVLRRRFFD